MRFSWIYRGIGLWCLILVLVTHGHDEYLILVAFIAWQEADAQDMRRDLRHAHTRIDIVADAQNERQ